jgi:hypothetical protein
MGPITSVFHGRKFTIFITVTAWGNRTYSRAYDQAFADDDWYYNNAVGRWATLTADVRKYYSQRFAAFVFYWVLLQTMDMLGTNGFLSEWLSQTFPTQGKALSLRCTKLLVYSEINTPPSRRPKKYPGRSFEQADSIWYTHLSYCRSLLTLTCR